MTELPEHVRRNRARWDQLALQYEEPGRRNWASDEPVWGIWGVPESQVQMLPDDPDGLDVIELGCGTAYVSAWLARCGAHPVAIDNSEAQLATAKRLQAEFGLEFPLVHGNAEEVPFPDQSFDLAISEYGASIWRDPYGGSRRQRGSCRGDRTARWINHSLRVRHPRVGAAVAMRRGLESSQDQLSARADRRHDHGFEQAPPRTCIRHTTGIPGGSGWGRFRSGRS